MKLKAIHREVRAALKLEQDKDKDDARANPLGVIAIKAGHKGDADMVMVAMRYDGVVIAGLSCGGSLCFGEEIIQYMTAYLEGDRSRAERMCEEFIINASHAIRKDQPHIGIIKNATSTAWRSFQPDGAGKLPSIETVERRARVIKAMPLPNQLADSSTRKLIHQATRPLIHIANTPKPSEPVV